MKTLIILLFATSATCVTFAQDTKSQSKTSKTTHATPVIYTCEMHPEVASSKPGKCPKCNMDLTASKKEQMKMEVMKVYSCPMHPEVQSKKGGKCPKCGMALEAQAVEKDSSKTKM
jgi:putative DNA topoisomerase